MQGEQKTKKRHPQPNSQKVSLTPRSLTKAKCNVQKKTKLSYPGEEKEKETRNPDVKQTKRGG
jgi:hypothetical protein